MRILVVYGDSKSLRPKGVESLVKSFYPGSSRSTAQDENEKSQHYGSAFLTSQVKKILTEQKMIPFNHSEMESVVTFRHYKDLNDYIYNFDNDLSLTNTMYFGEEVKSAKYTN